MKKILKLLIFVLVPLYANGQLIPLSSQYVLNTLVINPAYAGNRGVLNLAAFYRRQWVGIKGSPETMSLSADAPFNDGKLVKMIKSVLTVKRSLTQIMPTGLKWEKGISPLALEPQ